MHESRELWIKKYAAQLFYNLPNKIDEARLVVDKVRELLEWQQDGAIVCPAPNANVIQLRRPKAKPQVQSRRSRL